MSCGSADPRPGGAARLLRLVWPPPLELLILVVQGALVWLLLGLDRPDLSAGERIALHAAVVLVCVTGIRSMARLGQTRRAQLLGRRHRARTEADRPC
ncbi:hypothetical protein [Thermomonospora cellulosilytica]|uniref:Uncharacterized protein n=1 Tax=Thermomonospora cellulosilytica TaxID=1411118 RepID=A0A7W3RAR7_9ACTN|nr:hypothetical protein [Thermomonospora cellulosilytica]MBA9005984.1 hypothetical protein [Thermomonospora cellulosilytica]